LPSPGQFPALTGHWIGTAQFDLTADDPRYSQTTRCDMTLDINSQTGGTFQGRANLQGTGAESDKACTNIAAVSGTVTEAGALSDLRFDAPLHLGACMHVSGTVGYTGSASGTAMTVDTAQADRWMCTNPIGATFTATQTVKFSATKL
jgi:hypothetical protein